MPTLALFAALAQAPPPPPSTADAPSAVRLLFQAGDLRRAISMARACAGSKKKGFKECTAMLKPLVEYQALVGEEALTAQAARALLEAEQQISPAVPSKLSSEAVARFVTHPFQQALAAQRAGDTALAITLANQVLEVSPRHQGALAMVGGPDGGRPDAGHTRPRARDAGH